MTLLKTAIVSKWMTGTTERAALARPTVTLTRVCTRPLMVPARHDEYGLRIVALYDVQDLVQSAPDRENIFRGLNRAGTAPSPSSAQRSARVGRIAGISCVAAGLRPTTRCTLA